MPLLKLLQAADIWNRTNWRAFLLALGLTCGIPAAISARAPDQTSLSDEPPGYEWRALKTGAGGFIVGLDVHPSGRVVYVRADTGGAFRLDRTRKPLEWEQIVTTKTMPKDSMLPFDYLGVTAISSAPTNDARVYITWPNGKGVGRVYRSDNGGRQWSRTALALDGESEGPNGFGRTQGERLAIDPTDPAHVYYGSLSNGLWVTRNAGSSWQRVAGVPDSGESVYGVANVLFAAPPAPSRHAKRAIYATVYKKGIFWSLDNGQSWLPIDGADGPPTGSFVSLIAVGGDGALYAVADQALYVRRAGRWALGATPPGFTVYNVVADPVRSGRVLVFGQGGRSIVSEDWGSSFSAPALPERSSVDIPWHGYIHENFTIGNLAFDRAHPGQLWVAQGIGVWTSNPGNAGPIHWQGISRGIEQLVSTAIAAPPGGHVITGSWDRALFEHSDPDSYPATSGPTKRFNSAWDIAYAPLNPGRLAAVVDDHRQCCSQWEGPDNQSGTSVDGGRSWTAFPAITDGTLPKALTFGNIALAAADPDNLVWVPTNNGRPHFTRDGGARWQPAIFLDARGTTLTVTPFHQHFYLLRQILVADPLIDRRFYLFDGSARTLYRSDNGGALWHAHGTAVAAGDYDGDVVLHAVPGRSGQLCISNGGRNPLICTLDDGASWQPIPMTDRVVNFAFGAPPAANAMPALFIQGLVNGQPGIWCSTSLGEFWGRLATYPLGISAPWRAMDADKRVFGRVYGGTAGNGFIYGTPRTNASGSLCNGPK